MPIALESPGADAAALTAALRALRTKKYARVKKSADQNNANYTSGVGYTLMTWDATVSDAYGLHDPVTNNSRFTIPMGSRISKVRLRCHVHVSGGTGTVSTRYITFLVNGEFQSKGLGRKASYTGGDWRMEAVSPVFDVVPGDYFEVGFFQGSDTTINIGSTYSYFELEVVEEANQTESSSTADVLDGITLSGGYSVARRMRSAYSGSLIRVRRSSDNSEQDIGVDANGRLDESALLTFVGTGTGYIKTIYDQSGNSRDLTQTSTAAQAIICTGGYVYRLGNGTPAPVFNNGTGHYQTAAAITTLLPAAAYTVFASFRPVKGGTNTLGAGATYANPQILGEYTAGRLYMTVRADQPEIHFVNYASANTEGNAVQMKSLVPNKMVAAARYGLNGTTRHESWINGGDPTFNSRSAYVTAGGVFSVGVGFSGGTYYTGRICEVVTAASALSDANVNTIGDALADAIGETWTSYTGYILDQLSSAATAAFSTRRLRYGWTGGLIGVRRSSDNAQQDFGYDANGELDTAALLAFVGAGDGFIHTWIDQSGNGRHFGNATAANQPKIVSSGALVSNINSTPCLDFDGVSDFLQCNTTWTNLIGDASTYAVIASARAETASAPGSGWQGKSVYGDAAGYIWCNSHSGSWRIGHYFTTSQETFIANSGVPDTVILGARFGAATSGNLRAFANGGGSEVAKSAPNSLLLNQAGLIGRSSSGYWDGQIGEIVFFQNQAPLLDLNLLGQSMATRAGETWTTMT